MKEVQEPPSVFFGRIIWQRISNDKSSIFFGIFMLFMSAVIPHILHLIAAFLPVILFAWGMILIVAGLFAYRSKK